MVDKESESSGIAATTPPASEPSQTDNAPCYIRYTYEIDNRNGPDYTERRDNDPLDLQVSNDKGTEGPPEVLEIVTDISVMSKLQEPTRKDRLAVDSDSDDGKDPNFPFGNVRITDISKPRMIIHSHSLLEALREVVEYYPSQNLLGDTVTIREPYTVLLHHFTELRELKARLETSSTHEADDAAKEKCKHIQVLLDFLDPKIQRVILPAQKRLQKEEPTVTFDDLWYLLRPGLLAYATLKGIWLGCGIESVTFSPKDGADPTRWEVKLWFQDNTWRGGDVGRAIKTIKVEEFDGEKLVTSLPIYPRDYLDKKDGGKRRQAFVKRGRRLCDILWKGYSYVNHNGKFIDDGEQEYNGPMMVGSVDLPNIDIPDNDWEFDWDTSFKDGPDGLKDPERPESSKIVNPLALDPIKPSHSRDLMSEDHLFLMRPVVFAFALRIKTWTLINVDLISELEEVAKIPDAIIGADNLKMINALSDRQIKSKVPWSADYIKNKGEGVVVLLHGPPGVGKTYTVETTAISTGRPLVSLTIADLGTKEENIEAELTRWFTLAHKWRAILLIDEADIFLERRQHTDIARNGVVSAFLRKMEYFGGLLFLTTNRVGHIDEAFMSRVHVIIGFEKLDSEKRSAIWKSFLEKLHAEREGKIRVAPSATNFLLGKEMSEMDWNGREIRNSFQTAIALAEYDAVESPFYKEDSEIIVETEHFRRVMDMSKAFRAYLDSIRRDTEGERARDLYGRNDYHKASTAAGYVETHEYSNQRPAAPFSGQDPRITDPHYKVAGGVPYNGHIHYSPEVGAPRHIRPQ